MKQLPDWLVRAIKTFIQAFGGILIPELVVILQNGGFPADWSKLWAILAPILCSALAAGISAVWNIILEHLNKEEARNDRLRQ